MIKEKILPNEWKLTKMEEVCDIISGKNQSKVINPKGKYPIYGSSGIFGFADEYLCNEGTTVVGRKGTINSPLFVKTKFWNVDTAFGLSPKENYDNKLLYYFCLSFNFHKLDKSTTIPSLAKRDLLAIDIPLPPKLTQQAIVSKIEELFSELDKGIENLHTAQKQLKTYRQSVLKWAFEGKLTNCQNYDSSDSGDEYDLNIAAESIVEYKTEKNQGNQKNHINHSSDKGELPKGWKMVKIADICKVVRGGSPRPAGDPKYYDGNIPFLKVADVTKDDSMFLTTYKYTIKEAGLHKTRQIKPNTLLLSNSGATLGVPKICMIDATMNDGIAAFLELDERSNHFLYYFWLSKTRELRNINMGAAQPNLNTDIIRDYDVPYCSFEEQHNIVQAIESRLSVADKMEESITQSLQQAEALRQSILKKAFEGKLI